MHADRNRTSMQTEAFASVQWTFIHYMLPLWQAIFFQRHNRKNYACHPCIFVIPVL